MQALPSLIISVIGLIVAGVLMDKFQVPNKKWIRLYGCLIHVDEGMGCVYKDPRVVHLGTHSIESQGQFGNESSCSIFHSGT